MSPSAPSRIHVSLATGLLIAFLIVLTAWALASGVPLRELPERGISLLRAAGPLTFFAAMAFIPAPLAWFTIPAGEAFAGQLTLPGVIAAALAAVGIHIAFMYWLARYALRPQLAAWLSRRGHTIPAVTPENALRVTLIVRFTPGPPLALGCFVLGLAGVPFRMYLVASWLCAVPWVIGGIALGRGLLQGDFMLAASGLGLLLAAVLAVGIWRKRQPSPTILKR